MQSLSRVGRRRTFTTRGIARSRIGWFGWACRVYEAHVAPKRGQRWFFRQIARCPELRLVMVLTSFIKQRLVEMGFPAEKVTVLPDGVDLSLFESLLSKEECRCKLVLPLDCSIVGYIGRFRTRRDGEGYS
jgi:glycosyltransferase involved in cell wall biosynthesis